MKLPTPTRRNFLRSTASAVAGAPLWGAGVSWAEPSNDLLNVASIGVGGMIGRHDLDNISGAQGVRIAAMCDVDANFLGAAAEVFPDAKRYRDYRVMFEEMGNAIDAVVVSTPDHMHGPIALAAMSLGKHVYCQKPLAHNLFECRAVRQAADHNKQLVTQMGTQVHSHTAYRTGVSLIQAGAIGKVHEVHMWVSKSWDGPAAGRPDKTDPVPESLDWNLWLGVAPERPFVDKIYHPSQWRRWTDFGTGSLGDMGCHIFDPVFTALELGPPIKVVSNGPQCYAETFAPDTNIRYSFAGTKYTDAIVPLFWTDGTGASRPDAHRAQLPEGVELPGAGSFFVGEKGVMVLPHVDMPRFYQDGKPMEVAIEAAAGDNHYHQWATACVGKGQASAPFSYGCRVTEAVLVGTVATRFQGQELSWNSDQLTFDIDEATQLVRRPYRAGWTAPGLAGGQAAKSES